LTWFTLYDANNTWNKQLSNKSLLLLVKSRVETGKVSKEVIQSLLGTAKSDVDEKGFIVHGLLSSLNSSVVWHSIKFIPTKETPGWEISGFCLLSFCQIERT
jgi:hypothetical protein